MFELIYIWIVVVLMGPLLLRKVLVSSTTLTDNAASFVNQTADRLHMRKLVGRANPGGATVVGDQALSSFDEIPTRQAGTNNSRAHIASIVAVNTGGTGAITSQGEGTVLTFERDQLFLDPDEAWFMNNQDIIGAPNVRFNWNIWYED